MATGRTSKDGAWSGPCAVIVLIERKHKVNLAHTSDSDASVLLLPGAARFQPWACAGVRRSLSFRNPPSGCGEIGIHAGFRCLWALRPWRFESSQPHDKRPAGKRGVRVFLGV